MSLIIVHNAEDNSPILINSEYILKGENFSKGSKIQLKEYYSDGSVSLNTYMINESIEKVLTLANQSSSCVNSSQTFSIPDEKLESEYQKIVEKNKK